jgi:hypothetical protein
VSSAWWLVTVLILRRMSSESLAANGESIVRCDNVPAGRSLTLNSATQGSIHRIITVEQVSGRQRRGRPCRRVFSCGKSSGIRRGPPLTPLQYNKILTNQNKLGTDAEIPEEERSGEDN